MQNRHIPPHVIETAIARADLPAMIGAQVALKRHGKEFTGLCPFHNEKSPSFTVYPKAGGWRFKCFGCDAAGNAVRWLMLRHGMNYMRAVEYLMGEAGLTAGERAAPVALPKHTPQDDAEKERRLQALANRLWREAIPLAGTLAEAYLQKRGILIPPDRLPSLRFAEMRLDKEDPTRHPCMVAAVQNGEGKVMAIHRTFLRLDDKGQVVGRLAKKMLAPCTGGAIRFGKAQERIVLAEGIETALSILMAKPDAAVWAALDAGKIQAVALPPVVKSVVICADMDNKDPIAAQIRLDKAAAFYRNQGRDVFLAKPRLGGDFNDMLPRAISMEVL